MPSETITKYLKNSFKLSYVNNFSSTKELSLTCPGASLDYTTIFIDYLIQKYGRFKSIKRNLIENDAIEFIEQILEIK